MAAAPAPASTFRQPCGVVVIEDSSSDDDANSGDTCLVCGEQSAAMHYGAMACVGCKGFFRRALMKADQLECIAGGKCVVNKNMRTNCRSCRFRKCLDAGMKPAAVRPNRDYSSRQKKKALAMPEKSVDCSPSMFKTKDDWMKKLTVEMRTMLMNLLNIEAQIMKGDTTKDASQLYPLKINTLRELIEDPTLLKGMRSEMRYEPYRIAKNNELATVAYRRLIAAVDWVESLAELLGGLSIEDKIALIKNCFAPLMVFKFASRTAEVAKEDNILCLCNFAYVPRNISSAFSDSYHLGNGLVGRALDELVTPYRSYGMREEEIVCVSAMLALNPLARDLSSESFDKIMEMRNKVQDTLYTIVKEARMSPQPSVCFGHILLSLPIVTSVANTMCENLQFAQTFSSQGEIPLLTDLFGCFPVEPFSDDETAKMDNLAIDNSSVGNSAPKYPFVREKATQTEGARGPPSRARKRAHDMVDDHDPQHFRLLQPPGNFTLTEMFDDLSRASADTPDSDLAGPSTLSTPSTSLYSLGPAPSCSSQPNLLPRPIHQLPRQNLTRTQSTPVNPQYMVHNPYEQTPSYPVQQHPQYYGPPPPQFQAPPPIYPQHQYPVNPAYYPQPNWNGY